MGPKSGRGAALLAKLLGLVCGRGHVAALVLVAMLLGVACASSSSVAARPSPSPAPKEPGPRDRSPDPPLQKLQYVTRSSNGGAHWSAAKLVQVPVAASPVFLDTERWVMAGYRDRHVYFTHDAGGHRTQAEGLDAGLRRGSPGIQVMQSNREVVFLTFSASDIEWLDVSTDGGAHWRPVPLPDNREAAT